MTEHSNGIMSNRDLSVGKKKKRNSYSSEEDENFSTYISEERYRAMLGEHIQKYKRRLGNPSPSLAPTRSVTPVLKGSLGPRERKLGSEHRGGSHRSEQTSDYLRDTIPRKLGSYNGAEFTPDYGITRYVT